jgi:intein/homing endonuclease
MLEQQSEDWQWGWLAGLIDGEGFIHVHYRKNRDTTHPRLRVYSTTRAIIDEACRIMGVNPYVRRDHGKLVGWYAQASELKAIEILRRIGLLLTEPSKRCRAMTILRVFSKSGSIPGKHRSAEVFKHCPPPTRLRTPREI